MLYLCDTCVLIDYLRGKPEVRRRLENDRPQGLGMSTVTLMELVVGARNKREVGIIKKAFADFRTVEISEAISARARGLVEKYAKSHGLLIPDALIGATALELGTPLHTTNVKDFQFMPGLVLV